MKSILNRHKKYMRMLEKKQNVPDESKKTMDL